MLKVKSISAVVFSVLLFSTGLGTALFQHYQENEMLSPNNGVEVIEKELKYEKAPLNTDKKLEVLQKEKAEAESDKEQKTNNNSVLKTSSGFVTVFFVLVNYLFSGPLETQSFQNN